MPAVAIANGQPPLATPIPKKKVLLIGDYMKKHYEEKVREMLHEKADVFSPAENCGNTVDVMRSMPGWLKKYDPDIVYISCGFEDIRSVFYGSLDNLVPIKYYKRNVRNILEGVFMFSTKAVPLWATMTPINDERQGEAKSKTQDYSLFNDDVMNYNNAAQRVAKQYKVSIVDLYNALSISNPDSFLNETGFLLNGNGADATARMVAQHIDNYL